jgi:predicted DNA binding CopG/RHH family protein
MSKIDAFEKEVIDAYESGVLRSTMPSKSELKALREAARATSVKDRRVNIKLSTPDLRDLRARALEEGVPYQTLIESVLHKFIAGRLVEKPAHVSPRSRRAARKRAAG